MNRRLAIPIGAIALVVVGGWIAHRFSRREAAVPIHSSKQVIIAIDQNPTSLDPITGSMEMGSYMVLTACHAPLALVNERGELVPVIADSMTMSADAMRCEINLSAKARFWSGDPVTGKDVNYSLSRVARSSHPHRWILSRVKGAGISPADGVQDGSPGIEVVDAQHVVVHLRAPDPDFARFLSSGLTSIIKAGSDRDEKKPFDRHVIGCGPFKPANFEPGKRFEFDRSDGFPKRSDLDRLAFEVVDNSQNALQAVQDSRADILRLRGPMLAEAADFVGGTLKPESRFKDVDVVARRANELTMVLWNWKTPPLNEVAPDRRREILSIASGAFPRDAVVEKLYLQQAAPAKSVVPPAAGSSSYEWPTPAAIAKPIIGISLLAPNDADSRRLATFLQAALKPARIHLEVEFIELGQLVQRLLQGNYATALLWIEQQINSSGPIPWCEFFRQESPFSAIGQPMDWVGDSIEQARGALDSKERLRQYEGIVRRIDQEQSAFLPLLSRHIVLLKTKGVDGIFIDQNGIPYWTFISYNAEPQ